MNQWYVIQTAPNQEKMAERNIKQQGFDVFLPQYQRAKRIRDKEYMFQLPYFPSYLFVSFDATQTLWRGIPSIKGVQRVVSSQDDSATPLPRAYIDALKGEADENGYLKPNKVTYSFKDFRKGDEVVITCGHFMGAKGLVEQKKKNKLLVFLSLLQKKILVEVPHRMAELSNPSSLVR